jgi:DnaJ domain
VVATGTFFTSFFLTILIIVVYRQAAWGGHIALIRYLRDEHGLLDTVQDFAGNYAADLADMANTTRHAQVAQFLRQECSAARAQSCAVLEIPVGSSVSDIRKAYLAKARQVHPDRQHHCTNYDFDAIRRAYEHLALENGNGSQSNPAHSLNLMLELTEVAINESTCDGPSEIDDRDCFKARLIAVLLEYGDKGLDLRCVLYFISLFSFRRRSLSFLF